MDEKFLEAIREHVGNDVTIIDRNTRFHFICDGCRDGSSECCCNRGDDRIIINPYDIYKLVKGLNKPSKEVIGKYTEIVSGFQSGYPIFLLGTKELYTGEEVCTFIRRKTDEHGVSRRVCSVHDFKPGVCRVFPLGRVQTKGDELVYILQNINCGVKPKEDDPGITIADWAPNLENEDKAFVKYYEFLDEVHKIMDFSNLKKSEKVPETLKAMFYNVFLYMLCDFESDADYFEQFEKNGAKVIEFVKSASRAFCEYDKKVVARA